MFTKIDPVLPIANFSTNVTIGYAPLSVQFNDSSENATSWNWNFGDGTNSTQQNPVHTYSATGNYTINLTVSNVFGTASKLATVLAGVCPFAYISNHDSHDISIIDTATDAVLATVNVGSDPFGVAVKTAGTKVYVTNPSSNNVSVIDTGTDTVTATVNVGLDPYGIAVNPAGTKVYVANWGSHNVSIISTVNNTVIATVNVGSKPQGVIVNPAGTKVYVLDSRPLITR